MHEQYIRLVSNKAGTPEYHMALKNITDNTQAGNTRALEYGRELLRLASQDRLRPPTQVDLLAGSALQAEIQRLQTLLDNALENLRNQQHNTR